MLHVPRSTSDAARLTTHVQLISTWGKHATTPLAKSGVVHVNLQNCQGASYFQGVLFLVSAFGSVGSVRGLRKVSKPACDLFCFCFARRDCELLPNSMACICCWLESSRVQKCDMRVPPLGSRHCPGARNRFMQTRIRSATHVAWLIQHALPDVSKRTYLSASPCIPTRACLSQDLPACCDSSECIANRAK